MYCKGAYGAEFVVTRSRVTGGWPIATRMHPFCQLAVGLRTHLWKDVWIKHSLEPCGSDPLANTYGFSYMLAKRVHASR